ncbi:MAG: hypothetical protein ASARMPRED_008809 [Alectoria sarmentosa]|nr:MAG: hypothetical protein ASARMPRED_008809 [Alectoria sarmentosa]
MSLTSIILFFALVAYAVSASSLTGAENELRISLSSNVSRFPFSLNRSISPSNISIENALGIKCDGAQYGVNLDLADCKDAKTYISSGSEQVPWVARHTRWLKPHFVLPYRFMGDKGLCYFQIGLAGGYSHAYANLYEVQNAANAIISKCGTGDDLQGGSATNIGADGGLTMVLGAYQAAVECRGTFEPRKSCVTILDDVEVTQAIEIFGPTSDPAAKVKLPAVVKARDGKSSLRVLGKSDTTSWYRIWEAVMLVYSVCVRSGKGGSVKGLGDHGNIFLTMTA